MFPKQSQVRTSNCEPSSGDKSPLLSDLSRASSPRPLASNTLAVPSPSQVQKITKSTRKAAWGKFIRKTSEQMLGIPTQNKVHFDN